MASLDAFFRKMLEKGASDLHLTSGLPPHIREGGEMAVLEGEGGNFAGADARTPL